MVTWLSPLSGAERGLHGRRQEPSEGRFHRRRALRHDGIPTMALLTMAILTMATLTIATVFSLWLYSMWLYSPWLYSLWLYVLWLYSPGGGGALLHTVTGCSHTVTGGGGARGARGWR
eukprot:scaffold37110_cov39-Phaeocystis_antarctica.AAC.1